MQKITDIEQLKTIAKDVRRDILSMIYEAGSGHPGGSLSATDFLTVLFFKYLNHNPKNPKDNNRDRFILSKGHCCPVYYSLLARTGYFDVNELMTFRKLNSRLQGHPDKSKFDLMETTSGSLGQGLSIAAGIAFALRLDNNPAKVYCLLGDGELNEGQVWESLATINKYNLNNLIIIIDNNHIQLDGTNKDIKDLEPLQKKFFDFGFNTIMADGHDMVQIMSAFENALNSSNEGKNNIIIFNTVKGKGVSFMENTAEWHGKAPNKEQFQRAIEELR
ncbi:MAG: transketolase [Candidatus Woesearchaeota archaeon]|nr:MAG: transketolase [Candidatus Woesearchaeota archaeon]